MSYIQLKIQNNQAQYYKWTRLGSSIDILGPKKPCPQQHAKSWTTHYSSIEISLHANQEHLSVFFFNLSTCSSIIASDRLFLSLRGRSPITGLLTSDIFAARSLLIRALGVDMLPQTATRFHQNKGKLPSL